MSSKYLFGFGFHHPSYETIYVLLLKFSKSVDHECVCFPSIKLLHIFQSNDFKHSWMDLFYVQYNSWGFVVTCSFVSHIANLYAIPYRPSHNEPVAGADWRFGKWMWIWRGPHRQNSQDNFLNVICLLTWSNRRFLPFSSHTFVHYPHKYKAVGLWRLRRDRIIQGSLTFHYRELEKMKKENWAQSEESGIELGGGWWSLEIKNG